MLRPTIPEKEIKGFSTRNRGTHKRENKIKQDLVRGWGVSSRANLLGPWACSVNIMVALRGMNLYCDL
jgi:hypothetical protein